MNVLKTMRGMKLLKGLLWIIVISFIAAIFTLWGGGMDYEKSGGVMSANYAVKVGGQSLSPAVYRLQYRFYERQIRDMLGDSFQQSFLTGSAQRIANDMVDQLILAQMARDYGLSVSDQELVATIQRIYKFKDPKTEYPLFLSRLNVPAEDYQDFMRLQLLVEKLRNLFMDSQYYGDEELKRVFLEKNEKYNAMLAIVPTQGFAGQVQGVSADELKARFERDKATLKQPERRKVDYLSFSQSNLTDAVQVDEGKVRAYYDSHKDQYSIPANQRRASHILIRTGPDAKPEAIEAARKKIQGIYERAKAGEDFAKLAQEYSEDGTKAKGGDLGWFEASRMVKPFGDAVFTQCKAVGDVVGPVQTDFGFHVIKLTGLGGGMKPFDEVKAQIRQTILLSDKDILDTRKKLFEEAKKTFASAKDDAAFKAALDKYKLKTADLGPKGVGKEESLGPLGRDPKVKDALFSAEKGKWIGPFPSMQDSVVYFKVTDIIPAHPAAFEDVKEELTRKIVDEKAFALAQIAALRLKDSAKDAKSLEEAAKKENFQASQTGSLSGADSIPNVGKDKALSKALLAAKVGDLVGPVKTENGWVLAILTERTHPDMAKFETEKAELARTQAQQAAQNIMDDYVQRQRLVLEEKKAIHVNDRLVKSMEPSQNS